MDVKATHLKISGTTDCNVLHEPMSLERDVLVIARCEPTKVTDAWNQKAGGYTRTFAAECSELYVVEDELDAADLLHKLRAERQKAMDDLLGTPSLPLDDDPDDE